MEKPYIDSKRLSARKSMISIHPPPRANDDTFQAPCIDVNQSENQPYNIYGNATTDVVPRRRLW